VEAQNSPLPDPESRIRNAWFPFTALCSPPTPCRSPLPGWHGGSSFDFRVSNFCSSQFGSSDWIKEAIALKTNDIPALFPVSLFLPLARCHSPLSSESGIVNLAPFIFLKKPAFFLGKTLKYSQLTSMGSSLLKMA